MIRKPREEGVFRLQREYLQGRFGRRIRATRYGRGRVNSNWLVQGKKEDVVARFYPPFFVEKLFTELWVLRELNGCGGRVPKLIDVDTAGFSVPVLFMSRIPGVSLRGHEKTLGQVGSRTLINELRDLLDTVAAVPVSVYGYLHDPMASSSVADYVGKMASRYLAVAKEADLLQHSQIVAMEESLRTLQDISLDRKVCLSYPDLSSGNIIVRNGRFSGLVDWEFLMGFEPLYGFSNFLLELCSSKLQWMTPRMFVECFPATFRKRLVFLAMLRVAELLSYLPSTVLYKDSVKTKLLRRYQQDIAVLQEMLDSLKEGGETNG